MKKSWILVADSSRARFFCADTPSSSLSELEDWTHPEGRFHEREMTSDLPGSDSARGGSMERHAYQDEIEPKQQQRIDFAKRIAKRLEEARNVNDYQQLLIISEPSFLGTLRQQLTDQTKKLICYELDKNITMHSLEDIRAHLPEHLPGLL